VSNIALAQDGVRGGDDGLDYRILAAQQLATEALQLITPKILDQATSTPLITFCGAYKTFLLAEIKSSKILIRPADEVNAMVGGAQKERKATTGFTSQSYILINRDANRVTPVSELTAILLHEVGHHAGIRDENDVSDESDKTLFLNQFAYFVLENASKDNSLFQAKLYGNKPIYQLLDKEKRDSFSMGTVIDNTEYDVTVDLKEETFTFAKSEVNDSLFKDILALLKIRKDRGGPMFINEKIIAQGKIPPEDIARFYEINKTHITLNIPSEDPKRKLNYQVTLNYRNDRVIQVTIVQLKKDLPQWKKSMTLDFSVYYQAP
jgi:hypothetical protein